MNEQVFFSHFSVVSDELKQYAVDEPLSFSRYLFVRREKKSQMAYCTHCQSEYTVEGTMHKHNEETDCVLCHSPVTVKSHGIGRKTLVDQAYIVWYEKSMIDPTLLVATWYLATRDYNGDYRTVETTFQPRARYLFEPERGGTMYRLDERWNWEEKAAYWVWVEQKTISPMPIYTGGGFNSPRIDSFISLENVEQAVSDTYFAYLPWREYSDWQASEENSFSLIDFFALASKYPSVEYLAKMGLKKVVSGKMHGQPTFGVINWRGKSIEKVLKMDKQDIRGLRSIANDVTFSLLQTFHYWRDRGWDISMEDTTRNIQNLTTDYYKKILEQHVAKYAPDVTIIKYLLKQSKRGDAPKRYHSVTTVLTEWRDYLGECNELGIDIQQEHVLFPNNLHIAHEKMMQRVKIKQDEWLNKTVEERMAVLQQFALENEKFFIRPAKDLNELFEEGKVLNHCVSGYADRYAAGKTEIYLVRTTAALDTPFVTVEVINGKLIQSRGFKNSDPPQEVMAFLQDFLRHMKQVKRQQEKASRLSAAS